MTEQEKAEQLKKQLYYEPDSGFGSDEEEDDQEPPCDYTGEDCIGDRRFCEECPILTDEWEEEKPTVADKDISRVEKDGGSK